MEDRKTSTRFACPHCALESRCSNCTERHREVMDLVERLSPTSFAFHITCQCGEDWWFTLMVAQDIVDRLEDKYKHLKNSHRPEDCRFCRVIYEERRKELLND